MPVSFRPAKHPAKPFAPIDTTANVAVRILQWIRSGGESNDVLELLRSSFPTDRNEMDASSTLIAQNNGFVNTVLEAYNQHRALVIRPDDVWIAILSQFSFFVNANAESLRDQFVSHQGRQQLTVISFGDRYTVDYASMAKTMTDMIQDKVVDPSLKDWIIPDFSTTTHTDQIVGSILMMATMKAYFEYKFSLACGIPSVTIEGEKKDWENILRRIEKFKEYGDQTSAWYQLLQPVISQFVAAFDDPDSEGNLDFWNKVAHYSGGGSGPTWLSGWITAFCVFATDGKWLGAQLNTDKQMKAKSGFASSETLVLNGTAYHRIDTEDIPPGHAEVNVILDDNGVVFNAVLTAGHVATGISSSGDLKLSQTGQRDVARPVIGWWMYTVKDSGEAP